MLQCAFRAQDVRRYSISRYVRLSVSVSRMQALASGMQILYLL